MARMMSLAVLRFMEASLGRPITSQHHDFGLQAFLPGFLGSLFQLLGCVVVVTTTQPRSWNRLPRKPGRKACKPKSWCCEVIGRPKEASMKRSTARLIILAISLFLAA